MFYLEMFCTHADWHGHAKYQEKSINKKIIQFCFNKNVDTMHGFLPTKLKQTISNLIKQNNHIMKIKECSDNKCLNEHL